jgi:hypothetical protein
MRSKNTIISLQYIPENTYYLTINFANSWYFDEIPALFSHLMTKLTNASLIEQLLGADRYTYRIYWQQQHWLIHFESYSESCWLEHEFSNTEITQQEYTFWQKALCQ